MNTLNICLAKHINYHINLPACYKLDTLSLSQYIHQHYKLVNAKISPRGMQYNDIVGVWL